MLFSAHLPVMNKADGRGGGLEKRRIAVRLQRSGQLLSSVSGPALKRKERDRRRISSVGSLGEIRGAF